MEAEAKDDVMNGLAFQASLAGTIQAGFAAVDQFFDYFPGSNKLPDGGAWVLVKEPPWTEYTVPPLSIWFAQPWPMENTRHDPNRVKVVTPKGDLGLFPREYSRIEDVSKYLEFIGDGMEIKFFGGLEGVPKDALFYIRSRGVSKKDAITMLIGQIKAPAVCWIESSRDVADAFGKEWAPDDRLATVSSTQTPLHHTPDKDVSSPA